MYLCFNICRTLTKILFGSHPKYRAALAKRFPKFFGHMASGGSSETGEVESVQSVVTSLPESQA